MVVYGKRRESVGKINMRRSFAAILLAGAALAHVTGASAQSMNSTPAANAEPAGTEPAVTTGMTGATSVIKSKSPSADLAAMPAAPRGKSTIFGGEIHAIDPVRDELTLKIYGQRPMKILFDERTELYLDGKRIPLHDLRPEDHASVETALDGSNIFAVSIHALSRSPEGDYQGRVQSYNPGTGELSILSSASREPLKLQVPNDAVFVREGQDKFTSVRSGPGDLRQGSLVQVEFESGKQGRGVAGKITVLAVPGAAFAFSGDIVELDLHSGLLVLVDPRDQKSYQISFGTASLRTGENLHMGERVSVRAEYDGTHYRASQIAED
jgi:hypothetical protein